MMAKVIYVEALDKASAVDDLLQSKIRIFMAGGITGCPDWQDEAVKMLTLQVGWNHLGLPGPDKDIMLMNPRRANFPMSDPTAADSQIKWEFDHLRYADVILFWFCAEQIQPIVLFEYGYWLGQDKPMIVGCDPKYPRRADVLKQTSLARPELKIHSSLNDVCNEVLLLGLDQHR